MNFQGMVAISTGAASGMGLLFAQCFAELGGSVVMCDVNEQVLMEKAAEINGKGVGRAIACVCDVRDYQQVCAARDLAVSELAALFGVDQRLPVGSAARNEDGDVCLFRTHPQITTPSSPLTISPMT